MGPLCHHHRYGYILCFFSSLYTCFSTEDLQLHSNFFSLRKCILFFGLVKIIEIFVKYFRKLFLFVRDQALDLLVSVSYYITAFTPPTYQPCCLQGVLLTFVMGYLILKRVSRLDAFSVYLNRTPLLCHAAGATTDAQLVRSSRSSRTKDKPSQVSYAHDG